MGYGKTVSRNTTGFLHGRSLRTPQILTAKLQKGYSPNLQDYTFRAHANAIAAIAAQTRTTQLILGGHDWGGAVVYRVAQWYPQLIRAVFSIATPYAATSRTFTSTEELAKGRLPNFGYQLQLGSEDGVMEKAMGGDEKLVGKFLKGMYGGRTERGRPFMTPEKGVDSQVLKEGEVGMTPLLDEEVSFFFGFHPSCFCCGMWKMMMMRGI